jgi:hypothetical protein
MLLGWGDYPATGWTLTLKLNQPNGTAVSIAGTASGNNFNIVITAAVSAAMAVGAWIAVARVTETATGDVADAQQWDFTVLPNAATTIAKSAAQQQLDAANTALLSLIANPYSNTSVNGQSFSKENQWQLVDLIARLEAKVAAENAAAAQLRGDSVSRSIRPYFV